MASEFELEMHERLLKAARLYEDHAAFMRRTDVDFLMQTKANFAVATPEFACYEGIQKIKTKIDNALEACKNYCRTLDELSAEAQRIYDAENDTPNI